MLPSPHLQDYKITLSATISQEILIVALIIRPLIFFNSSFSPACLSLIFYPITWPKRVKNSFISPMIKVVSIVSSWSGVHGPMDFHFFSFFLMSHLIFYTFSSSMWEKTHYHPSHLQHANFLLQLVHSCPLNFFHNIGRGICTFSNCMVLTKIIHKSS